MAPGSLVADQFVTWECEYIDKWSNGNILHCSARVDADVTEEDMIKHWGLNSSDVSYYKLTKIED